MGLWFCLMSVTVDDSTPPESCDHREPFVAAWYSYCTFGIRLAGMSLVDGWISSDREILYSATLLRPAVCSQLYCRADFVVALFAIIRHVEKPFGHWLGGQHAEAPGGPQICTRLEQDI